MTRQKPADGIARCRSCNAPVWWKRNPSGKFQPFDLDLTTNTRTNMPHHATCKLVKVWRPAVKKAAADGTPMKLPFL